MRTFALANSAGEYCDITDKKLFFHDVSGLGFSRNSTFRQVGDRWVQVNKKAKQGSISGKVAFLSDDPYFSYFNFVQFISKEPLIIMYKPNDTASSNSVSGITYRRSVTIRKLDKDEINHDGYLDCSIEFDSLGPWYKYVAISNGTDEVINSLKWGVTWGINWGPLDDYSKGIMSESGIDSPSKLTIFGPVNNPSWKHYVNGIVLETGKLNNVSVGSNEYIVVDKQTIPSTIRKYSAVNGEMIEDLYDRSDFSTQRFITIKSGINTVSVTGEEPGSIDPLVKLEAYIYYESV